MHDNFLQHYLYYKTGVVYSRNVTVGDKIILRNLICNNTRLPQLTKVYKKILAYSDSVVFIIAYNITHARVDNHPGDNPVIQTWRNTLLIVNFAVVNSGLALIADLAADLTLTNK